MEAEWCFGASMHQCSNSKRLAIEDTGQGGGARTTSRGPKKRRIGAALGKTTAYSRYARQLWHLN